MGLSGVCDAAQLEVAARVGQALPFFEQTVNYDPGSTSVIIPGLANIDLEQRGSFVLDGKGGSTIGASATLYPVKGFGFEARVDSAALDIKATGATYHVRIDLPSPIPDISRDLKFDNGVVDVDRLKPISLNLKLKTPGRVSLMVSGGVSYLPEVHIDARQRLGFGVTTFNSSTAGINVGSVVFRAQVRSKDDQAAKRIGGNVGGGIQLQLGGPLALQAEARYFTFPKHKLDWHPEIEGVISPLESRLLEEVEGRIDPLEFYPAFFQATIGVSLTVP
jgi:hypothetical protein